MAVQGYAHTKQLIAEHVSLATDSFTAAMMEDNYDYNAAHTSYGAMQALGVQTVAATFTTSYDANGIYRAYIDPLLFSNVTADADYIVVFADGFKNGIDRPVMFAVSIGQNQFASADFILSWDSPFFQW